MNLDPALWSKLHGAATHFPIALVLVSAFCDGASLLPGDTERQREFRFTAVVALVLGALGGDAAVVSGLVMTKGQACGRGDLLRHHLFVWPAFALMSGLAAWRIATRHRTTARPTAIYLALMFLSAALTSGAGYWGGELLNQLAP